GPARPRQRAAGAHRHRMDPRRLQAGPARAARCPRFRTEESVTSRTSIKVRHPRDAMWTRGVVVVRTAIWLYVTVSVLILAVFVAAATLWTPLPPRVVVMTTGAPGGSYEAFAQQYKRILARAGVELRLMPSDGAV